MDGSMMLTSGLCFLVGISLGLFGGGGSVLTVPIFVYFAHYSVSEAIALSLVTVGAASLMASVRYLLRGLVNGRLVLTFFLAGSVTSFAGAQLTGLLSERLLMLLFGSLMAVIAVILYVKSGRSAQDETPRVCRPGLGISLVIGAGIGFLTGFLGVGGGFLIVPAIALLMRCSLQTAIGTSLVIITLNSAAGYFGHLHAKPMALMPAALFVLVMVLGTFVGNRLGLKVKSAVLQRGFAGMIFLLGLFLILENVIR
jgi:hypothetical protein